VETIATKVRFHTFAAIGSLCSIGQFGLFAAIGCGAASAKLNECTTLKDGPFLTFTSPRLCCDAARQTGPSLRPQKTEMAELTVCGTK